jgi:hypothetical protein
MQKGKIFYRSARLAGILLLIATVVHCTAGTAEVLSAIKVGQVMDSMVPFLKNLWIYSSVMIFLSALWVLFLAKDLSRLRRSAWWQGVLIGLGYTGGAVGAMAWAGIQAHLVAFAVIGLVLLIPLILRAGAFKTDANSAEATRKPVEPA